MASAAFLGLSVHLYLRSGEHLSGTISAVDPVENALTIQSAQRGMCRVRRDEIADLQMASSSPAQPAPAPAPAPVIPSPGPPQAAPAFVDPAILSFNSRPGTGPPTPSPGALPAYASSSAASKSVPQQILAVSQSTPAAAASGSETGGTSRSAKRRQKEKEKRSTQSAGTSAAPELPTPFTASTPEVGGRRGRKERSTESAAASNPSAQSALAPSTAPMRPGGFGEDFDFESGLKGFDKKKIWEEIRNADMTDPSTLLVSHNRAGPSSEATVPQLVRGPNGVGPAATPDARSRGRTRRNDPQSKLAPNEPVLSPSPPTTPRNGERSGAHDQDEDDEGDGVSSPTLRVAKMRLAGRKSSVPASSPATLGALQTKTADGNISEMAAELSKLRTELARTQQQAALLEALAGVEVSPAGTGDAQDETRWTCTVWDAPASHAAVRRASALAAAKGAANGILDAGNESISKGALRFGLSTSSPDSASAAAPATLSRLRYLGPISSRSDPALVARLPLQYARELGLKPESAAVFARRLKDAIAPSSTSGTG